MNQERQPKIGLIFILVSLFLILAPLPFLETSRRDQSVFSTEGLPNAVLRLGQSLTRPKLVEVPSGAPIAGMQRLKIDGVPFEVQIDRNMTHDEFEAIIDAVALQRQGAIDIQVKFARFDGWEPAFLPLRIEYRYILVVALVLMLCAIYTFAGKSRECSS